jgi:hypothetical protein
MSEALSKYTFLPWLRRGISTQIARTDDGTQQANAPRSMVTVGVSIGGGPSSAEVDVPLSLFSSGDVRSFDTGAVTRRWPRPDDFEVEPNLFPAIELFPADLPWRYTPARANAQDRLRPWLGLIVLRNDEIEPSDSSSSRTRLTTKSGVPLPPTDQLWAWAHVHVDGAETVTSSDLLGMLDLAAHRVVSRLLCPRRLDERTMYTAFLVPTLAHAANAALGVPVDPTVDALTPAWKNDGTPVTLPVFYSWSFRTSATGSFASLAQRIISRKLPATVGLRPMDVSMPGLSLPPAASGPLAAESALRALDTQSTAWPDTERQKWTTALAGVLNLPSQRLVQAGAPVTLTPPLYGRWYAAQNVLDPTARPPWFEDLNADPRLRVAASLGARVVQEDQPHLLAGAWAQVEGIREANAELRHAQLAREAALRMWARHVLVRPETSLLTFTQPLHARTLLAPAPSAVLGSPPSTVPAQTLRLAVQHSPLRCGVLLPAFRKLARSLGPVGWRQGRALSTQPSTLLQRINTGELRLAPPPPPSMMATPARTATEVAPAWLTPQLAQTLQRLPSPLWWLVPLFLLIIGITWLRLGGQPKLAWELVALAIALLHALENEQPPAEDIGRRLALREGTLQPAQIQSAAPRPGFVAQELRVDGTMPPATAGMGPEDRRFRQAAIAAFGDINVAPRPGAGLRELSVASVTAQLRTALDPRLTVAATFAQRLVLQPGVTWNPPDPIEPVMAAPTFSQPLYKPLYDLSPDWILTGLDQLPQDTVTLAKTNDRFIECFMLGANDEMARTLLFNEYPTDQRGTYFRQFWDVRGYVASLGQTIDPETLKDIRPIDRWLKTAKLGDNSSRITPEGGDFLVLLMRAELLSRYPNTMVYAVRAVWKDGAREVPAQNAVELWPDFSGALSVGVGFWAFRLTAAQARGKPSPEENDAGWFFALQEHISEPRFGLEAAGPSFDGAPTSWQKLSWSDVATDTASLAAIGYLDLAASLPNTSNVIDPKAARWHVADGARASDLAYITWREPVRLLIQASRMIPADT